MNMKRERERGGDAVGNSLKLRARNTIELPIDSRSHCGCSLVYTGFQRARTYAQRGS